MKKWILKALVQKTISYLPYSNKVNFLFQKHITKGVFLSNEYFFDRLGHAENHLAGYLKMTGRKPKSTLELGTGWYPIAPLSMFLAGADKIHTIDISPLLNKERLLTTLERFVVAHENGDLKNIPGFEPQRMEELKVVALEGKTVEFKSILRRLNIVYLVGDARKMPGVADGSIDLAHSNNTFEHVYPKILSDILLEFKRVVNNGGVQSHFIDMSDHFAHFDKNITIYNFLQFSDRQWSLIDNSIQPQNRFRMYDYQKIYQEVDIPVQKITTRPGNLEELSTIRLDKKFQGKSPEELAISHCHFFSHMNGG